MKNSNSYIEETHSPDLRATHARRGLSQGKRFVSAMAGPSAIRPKGEQMEFYYGEGQYALPRAMIEEDIADAIEGFASAARLAVESAGFNSVEIHGANGYLFDRFFTDHTSQRTDRWGASVRNRTVLTLEVIKAVRALVGGAPVGVWISQCKVNDYAHKWAEDEAGAETIFGYLADAGINYVHVTEQKAWTPAFSDSGPAWLAWLVVMLQGSLQLPMAYWPTLSMLNRFSMTALRLSHWLKDRWLILITQPD